MSNDCYGIPKNLAAFCDRPMLKAQNDELRRRLRELHQMLAGSSGDLPIDLGRVGVELTDGDRCGCTICVGDS